MAERIPQSVAYLVIFRAFLASDGKTPATGKTIAITISKNGATSFSNPNAGATNATEMASGFYKFTLDTTDTGTVGPLAWRGAQADINDAGDVLTVVKATNGGFSALPDAAAEAAGGLFTRGTGAGQINQPANGQVHAVLADSTSHGGSSAVITFSRLIGASATTNEPAVKLTGNGSAAGLNSNGGSTGAGLALVGGSTSGAGVSITTTSGDGVSVTPTAGHALVLTANGASKNGLRIAGGTSGTSHGVNIVAGSGGEGINVQSITVTTNLLVSGAVTLSGAVSATDASNDIRGIRLSTAGLAAFFTSDSGEDYASAVAGSVVKEIADNAGGASLTVQDIVDGVFDEAAGAHTGIVATALPNLDAAITSRMATYTQPTGFLAATFPSGTVANTTNITAGTITTVTNLTNAATAGDLTATMKASVNSEVDAAIETYHLDHLLAVTYDPASKPGAGDALLNELVESDSGVSRFTANALEQAPSGGASAADIADAVWEEAISDHSGTSGSTAEALNAAGSAGDPWVTALPGSYTSGQAGHTVGTFLTGNAFTRLGAPAGASVSADVAAVKTDTGNLTTRITSALFSGITSMAEWLGLIAGKQTGNSTARTEIRATGVGSGTFDETTDSQQAIRDRGDTAWITAAGFSTLDAAGVRTAVGLASANLDTQLGDLPTNAELATALAAADDAVLSAISTLAGYVDTEVAQIVALLTAARAEPGQGSPSVNPDVLTKIDYLYKAWRNRFTQTSSEYSLYADNGTTKDQKATVSDNGTTFDRGEVTTGA